MSRNPNATLESTEGAAAGSPATGRESSGRGARRAARRRKGLIWRFGIIIPAIGAAAALVVIVTVVSYVTSPNGRGVAAMSTALNGLTHSRQMTMLEQERQQIAVMDSAARTLTTAASPTKVDPQAVIQAAQQSASNSSTSSSSSSSSSTVTQVTQVAPPNPGSAEQIGYDMLPSFGFNQTTQWSCLEQLWMRESGWNYYAQNPQDGAYGIPQAFPGDKMATVAADWRTNPATQIKWGLEYISSTYGTPCGAWNEELTAGGY